MKNNTIKNVLIARMFKYNHKWIVLIPEIYCFYVLLWNEKILICDMKNKDCYYIYICNIILDSMCFQRIYNSNNNLYISMYISLLWIFIHNISKLKFEILRKL